MSEGANLSIEARDAKAGELGLVVVEPEPFELFVDLDDDFDIGNAVNLALAAGLKVTIVSNTPSRTEGHRHVVLVIDLEGTIWDELTPELRIALQCCFGSDRKRELLSIAGLLSAAQPQPTVFFETP